MERGNLSIRVVRLGAPREPDEGLRLGTVRRPPRGVRKDELGLRDYFDLWLPELAPSDRLLRWGGGRAVHAPPMGNLRSPVSNRDAEPLRAPAYRSAGGILCPAEPVGGLLLC